MKKKNENSIRLGVKLSSKLKKIVGAVKLPKNYSEEKELRSSFEKKHL